MNTNLYDLDPGPDSPEIVRMIVEIPKNSSNKYEYDGKLGVFRLDRTLYSPLHYPGDYGFIPGTLAEDADPLDVLVLVDEASRLPLNIETQLRSAPAHIVDYDERTGVMMVLGSVTDRPASRGCAFAANGLAG